VQGNKIRQSGSRGLVPVKGEGGAGHLMAVDKLEGRKEGVKDERPAAND